MEYVKSIVSYLKTPKTRHDLVDVIRAVVVIASVMAMVRIFMDTVL